MASVSCVAICFQTALVKVMNDIPQTMNSQQVTLMVLLDLISAFHTVNYEELHSLLLLIGLTYLEEVSALLPVREQCHAKLILSLVFHKVHVCDLCYSLFASNLFKTFKEIRCNYALFRRWHTPLPDDTTIRMTPSGPWINALTI